MSALIEVDGYKDYFVVGAEPEMCCHLRHKSRKIYRFNSEMTLHDANITRFSQWRKRANRVGFTFALAAKEHGKSSEKFGARSALRALFWSGLLGFILILSTIQPVMLSALLFTHYKS
jgi:hypothetical protein